MLNADFLVLKVNGIPFQAHNFTAPQTVECSHDNAELCRVALDCREKLFQFFTAVNLRLELFLTRTFNAICRVGTDHVELKSILQAFADAGVIVNDGVCRKATIQLMLVEVLDVFGMLFHMKSNAESTPPSRAHGRNDSSGSALWEQGTARKN